jgi:hypothetical protein
MSNIHYADPDACLRRANLIAIGEVPLRDNALFEMLTHAGTKSGGK